ncbi:MAG: alpha/beta fold hydrolase [Polyangiaceae bacterium]
MTSLPPHRVVSVLGVDLHWVEFGKGPPLVLLHGLCDSSWTWLSVAPALARSRRVLMLDLPGHGLSARPDASYSLEWHARMVGGWLGALGLERVDVVGHSFGGGVAQWLLLEHRACVRRLALVATGGLGREVGFPLRFASIPFFVERFGQPFMARGTKVALSAAGGAFGPEDIAQLARLNAIAGTARAFSRSVRDVIDWRGQIRHFLDRAYEVDDLPPLAVFWGEEDPLIPVRQAVESAALLEGVTLTRFAGCGHFPHRQEPERFVRELEAFLDAPSLPGARVREEAVAAYRARHPQRSSPRG